MSEFSYSQAIQYLQQGNALAARQILLKIEGQEAQRDFLLGACAYALNEVSLAISCFSAALRKEPSHAQSGAALGSLLAGLGRKAEAEAVFRKTLKYGNDHQLHFNLSVFLEDDGRLCEALEGYNAILASDPAHYAARHNRAGLYTKLQRLQDAVADYRYLVRRHPEALLSWHNLAELELANSHYEEAIRLLKEVTKRMPDNGKALSSLAIAYAADGDMVESRAVFVKLKELDITLWRDVRSKVNDSSEDDEIDPRTIFLVRAHEHMAIAHWKYWSRYADVYRDILRKPVQANYLPLAYSAILQPLQAEEQLDFMRLVAGNFESQPTIKHTVVNRSGRLRVAYVAPHWGNHVTSHLFRQLLTAHSTAFEVFVVGLRKLADKKEIDWLKAFPAITFVDVADCEDQEAAAKLAALDLDIAIDLGVFNDDNRPAILASRPARVQLSWQATPYSSGAPWLDYIVADNTVRPCEGWCSEAEITLPGCYFTFGSAASPVTPSRQQVGLPEQRFVFGNLGNTAKLSPPLFRCWMTLLNMAPASVLWLLQSSPETVANLRREAEWCDIDPDRLLFAPRVGVEAHIARMGAIDLFLDTWYCNGHTTVAECLWAGTPVVTLKGDTFASRVGASLLESVGLPQLITQTEQNYIELALAFYQTPSQLAGYRQYLQGSRQTAACFDTKKQIQAIELVFQEIMRRYQQGMQPSSFKVADLRSLYE